jgi:heavy metal translocating P-type ATPase
MTPERCVLCGRRIADDPVARHAGGRDLVFDTEDCARVFEAAEAAGMLDAVLADGPAVSHGTGGPRETAFFAVSGMWCPMCAEATRRVLAHTAGVRSVEVSFALGKGRIEYDPSVVTPDELIHRVERLGYHAALAGEGRSTDDDRFEESLLIQLLVALAFGMQVMVLYLVRLYGLYGTDQAASADARTLGLLMWALATPVLLYGGQTFLRGAFNEIVARRPGMDTLVALGTVSAYSYSVFAVLTGRPTYFDSVTMIIQFVMVGRYLEAIGGGRARKGVRALLELQPRRAWSLLDDGSPLEVRAADLVAGDRIAIKTGERVPTDATVLTGRGAADESLLSGESSVAPKREGDTLWAGTMLAEGPVTATVLRSIGETRLASIRELVEATLVQKPPVQRLADTASAWLTFAILATAVVTFTLWTLSGAGTARALLAAVAVLVVACPCALGLATPLAISVAIGRATRGGVLVRVPAALETAATVTRIAFDKTGTLTEGHLELRGIRVVATADADEVAGLVAGVEALSEHPLGRALAGACATPALVRDIRAIHGQGVIGIAPDDREVRVGAERLMPGPIPPEFAETASSTDGTAESVVWIAIGGEVVGAASLRDTVVAGAVEALAGLRGGGHTTVLLSGDSESTTAAVARALGFTEHRSRLTPEEKAAAIADWQLRGERVAMVGDGVNDAPGLARANIAVTVAGGTDVAGQTSDIVLARRDLALLPWFLCLSAATRRITRENLGWALLYNGFAVPLAATGLISPAIAAAAMAASSLLVVGNSLRLGLLMRDADRQMAAPPHPTSATRAADAAGAART